MSIFNPFAFAFVGVAAGFVVATDYVVQAKANGSYPGEYPVSSYIGSYTSRYTETLAAIDKTRRQSEEARIHLPDAPEGWQREKWDVNAIDTKAALAGLSIIAKMAAKGEITQAKVASKDEIWEYSRDAESIRVMVRFDPEPEVDDIQDWGPILAASFGWDKEPVYKGFAMIDGVPFLEITNVAPQTPQRILQAELGDSIHIAVSGNAKPQAMYELLSRIDFDNLNLMLDEPVDGVGSDAPALSSADAANLLALHAAAATQGTDIAGVSASVETEDQASQRSAQAQVQTSQSLKLQGGQGLSRDRSEGAAQGNRLQLSGGRSCLGGSTSKLCN